MIWYHNSPLQFLMITMLALLLLLMNPVSGRKKSCDPHHDGPSVRCPFQLLDDDGIANNHSGFALYCTQDNKTMLHLPADPVPLKLLVHYIRYDWQLLYVSDPQNCPSKLFLSLHNIPLNPFRYYSHWSGDTAEAVHNITFFDCSSVGRHHLRNRFQTDSGAQDMLSCPIYAADSSEGVINLDLFSCIKLFDRLSPVDGYDLQKNYFRLEWRSNLSFDTRCIDRKHQLNKHNLATSGEILGSVMLLLVLTASFFQIYRYFRKKEEDHARVENFLKDYRAQKPTRFSYADIKRITHKFKDKLGEGAHGAVYKGKLNTEILVAVKILNNTEGDGKEFINEVGTMGKIHHVNVVRLLGFCADGFYRALVYDFFPNGSLQKFISPSHADTFLGWDKLQQIALGIANGIEYLHQGCDQTILHFDINPHNILLDDTLTPKISDFGLAKLCSKNQSEVSMTAARGTLGYMAPEVFSRNFGNVSYKSDIYSYGMLLLEMVGGRKNVNTSEETLQVLYPEWIHNLLERRDTLHIPIDDEGDFEIAKKLAIVGLRCIQWSPMQRPSMKTVIRMLQGDGDKLKVPPTPFDTSATSTNANATIPARRLNLELEVIQELD